jgi:hypothetical protein
MDHFIKSRGARSISGSGRTRAPSRAPIPHRRFRFDIHQADDLRRGLALVPPPRHVCEREAGRNAHLNGKVAAALMEKAKSGDLFAKMPEIHKLDILADKLPK